MLLAFMHAKTVSSPNRIEQLQRQKEESPRPLYKGELITTPSPSLGRRGVIALQGFPLAFTG